MNDKIMMKRDIVIIGGGPAGLAAARVWQLRYVQRKMVWMIF